MDLQIYIDNSSHSDIVLEDISDSVFSALSEWIGAKERHAQLLDKKQENEPASWKLGMSLKVKSKYKLKDPLTFLYSLAQEHKCEFVIAEYDANSDSAEDVCFFGFEEGRPDLHEIANYLGL